MSHDDTNRGNTKRQIARLIGGSARPMYVLSDDQVIVFVNEAMERLCGLDSDRLLGLKCSLVGTPIDSPYRDLAMRLALPPVNVDRDIGLFRSQSVGTLHSAETHELQFAFSSTWDSVRCIVPLGSGVDGYTLCVVGDSNGLPLSAFIDEPASMVHDSLAAVRAKYPRLESLWFLAGRSFRIEQARRQIHSATQNHQPVLIVGPKGSNREWVANEIHRQRALHGSSVELPMATIECPLMDNALLQGTLEAVDESYQGTSQVATLLLSGIDQLASDSHETLARYLEADRTGRFLATSSVSDLQSLNPNSRTWERISSSIDILRVDLPMLSQRTEDIAVLATAWSQQFALAHPGEQPLQFSPNLLDALHAYRWPMDVEELSAALEHSRASCKGRTLTEMDLPSGIRTFPSHVEQPRSSDSIDLDKTLESIERSLILRAIERHPRNRTSAAKLLNISRARLLRRLQQWGIQAEPEGGEDSDDSPVFRELPE